MQAAFDPYYRWLGIPPNEQPADFYRLLGVPQFEPDDEVISNAADSRMGFVRTFQSGRYSTESQRLLNELSIARVVLLDPAKRREYDARLRATAAPVAAPAAMPMAAPAPAAWNFHPPAPGYSAATPYYPTATAPYPQAVPYPQAAPWLAPQAVPQAPQPANFVGGVLAEAEAAKAAAQMQAPAIIKSLPPAARRRESTWRNPWMVAAGGTLLTIIAVLVMLRAGDFANEPELVERDIPEITVPAIDVFGDGKQLKSSKPKDPAVDRASPLEPMPMTLAAAANDPEPAPKSEPAPLPVPMPVPMPAAAPAPLPTPASSDPAGSASPPGEFSREEARAALAKLRVFNPPNETNANLGPQFTDDYARYLLAFPEINYVQAINSPITGKTLEVLGKLKKLKTLMLMQVRAVTDDDLKHLANAQELERLSCSDTGIKGAGIAHLAKLKNIKYLQVGPSPVGEEPWRAIGQLKSLEAIPRPGPDFNNASLELLANLTELKSLHLSSTQVNGDGYRHLAGLSNLNELYLPTTPANPSEYQYLGKLKQLRTLSCGNSGGDEALDYLSGLTELQYLLPPADITDAGLATLARFPNLQRTNLFNCGRTTDGGLANLAKCDKLVELVVGQHVTAAGWRNISNIKSLKSIQAGAITIPADVLPLLGTLPNLDSLAIGNLDNEAIKQLPKLTKLKSLHIEQRGYSPADLESISRIGTLEHLHLHSPGSADWTDEHVAVLKKMTQLKYCLVFGNKISPANLEALKQANPKCQWAFN